MELSLLSLKMPCQKIGSVKSPVAAWPSAGIGGRLMTEEMTTGDI